MTYPAMFDSSKRQQLDWKASSAKLIPRFQGHGQNGGVGDFFGLASFLCFPIVSCLEEATPLGRPHVLFRAAAGKSTSHWGKCLARWCRTPSWTAPCKRQTAPALSTPSTTPPGPRWQSWERTWCATSRGTPTPKSASAFGLRPPVEHRCLETLKLFDILKVFALLTPCLCSFNGGCRQTWEKQQPPDSKCARE